MPLLPKTKVTISQIGKEQQNTWIGSSQITNIKELSKLLSDKMKLEDGEIIIKKFDDDFGENISVKDDEKFDPTKVYNIELTQILKYKIVVEPDLTYLNEQSHDFNVENKDTNVEKVADMPIFPVSSSIATSIYVKVKITNGNGKSIFCYITFCSDIVENIKSLKNHPSDSSFLGKYAYCKEPQIKIPSFSSQIKKRYGIEWYLYCDNGEISVMHRSTITHHYLLAEMAPVISGFKTAKNCKIEIV
uniref:Uncharacterized protein n=1 Tax=Panagrolaimus davidi TaxID=227884 RepID=A0A914P3W8_9BILA